MARRLRSETATAEFEPYLEPVTRSGERARTIVYATQRLHIMLDNSGCVAGIGPPSADCKRLLADYADQGLDFTALAGIKPSAGKSQRDLALQTFVVAPAGRRFPRGARSGPR
jgi:hypothetical protein